MKVRRSVRLRIWLVSFSAVIVILLGGLCLNIEKLFPANEEKVAISKVKEAGTAVNAELPWNLILVNSKNPVPDNYEVRLLELSNGRKVDERIYPELQQMFDDARADGLELFVAEGYRTREDQQRILDSRIDAYMNEGNSKKEAKRLALMWVAEPGTSEHELGISVDINADKDTCSSDDLYAWLKDNAYKYGFIMRYPEDKADVTGVNNEPWHYRYVGKEAADQIYSQGICLEEYIEMKQR